MIDGIRRRLGSAAARDLGSADEKLKTEVDERAELPEDTTFLVTAPQATGRYAPDGPGTPDYYKSLVKNAIENGGRLGYHSISVPWLRMILAGLESKQIEPEAMWYGIEANETRREPVPEIPPYDHLFLSGQEV